MSSPFTPITEDWSEQLSNTNSLFDVIIKNNKYNNNMSDFSNNDYDSPDEEYNFKWADEF